MPRNLTNAAAPRLLDSLNGVVAWAPSTPLRVALMTVNGTDALLGIECRGASYRRRSVEFVAAGPTGAVNTDTVSFINMPACTVVGVEIYDASGLRVWHGPLAGHCRLNAGDTFEIDAYSLHTSID